ncbi:MAG TPA: signal peptidase I [Edaphobacter sp.]|nr:signal peptidase I [Edaphobacter sp.]
MIDPAISSDAPSDLSEVQTQSLQVLPESEVSVPPPMMATQRPPQDDWASMLHSVQSLIYIIVVAVFIITFCVQPFRIPSGSMESTLLVGDFLLVNKQATALGDTGGLLPTTAIHRGQIIVFHYPIEPSIHLVKRVVGMPGDHLKMREGRVFINGSPLEEPYAVYRPSGPDSYRDNFPRLQSADPNIDSRWWIRMRTLIDDGELIIPADNYFVLGDNRNNSEDSRYWGFVPRAAIVGQPFLIYFSLHLPGNDDLSVLAPEALARQRRSGLSAFTDFARWDRVLQVVR